MLLGVLDLPDRRRFHRLCRVKKDTSVLVQFGRSQAEIPEFTIHKYGTGSSDPADLRVDTSPHLQLDQ